MGGAAKRHGAAVVSRRDYGCYVTRDKLKFDLFRRRALASADKCTLTFLRAFRAPLNFALGVGEVRVRLDGTYLLVH